MTKIKHDNENQQVDMSTPTQTDALCKYRGLGQGDRVSSPGAADQWPGERRLHTHTHAHMHRHTQQVKYLPPLPCRTVCAAPLPAAVHRANTQN